jgi:hypothetical protein
VSRLLALPVVALLFATATAERPLRLDGPQRQAKQFPALIASRAGTRLSRVGEDLRPYGPKTANVGYVDAWALPPEGSLAVLAAHPLLDTSFTDYLRFVDLDGLRVIKRAVELPGSARALLWRHPHRVVALVDECCAASTAVVVVDPAARRVLSKEPLGRRVVAVARSVDSLVLLKAPPNEIGTAKLVVVDPVGGLRSVELAGVTAGFASPADGSAPPLAEHRVPALVVDRESNRALVIQPDGLAAEISLGTLGVAYHELSPQPSLGLRLSRWLQPAAEAKGINGPVWRGVWLGDGMIAISGSNSSATLDANNVEHLSGAPAGVALVDTRDWTMRMLDRGADEVTVAEGALLVTGRAWASGRDRPTGMGVAAYGPDRTRRFAMFAGSSAYVEATWRNRAWVRVDDAALYEIDLGSGRVVGQRSGVPTLLLQSGPDR